MTNIEEVIACVPHSSLGDEDCCGCLVGDIENEMICNECDQTFKILPTPPIKDGVPHWRLAINPVNSQQAKFPPETDSLPDGWRWF